MYPREAKRRRRGWGRTTIPSQLVNVQNVTRFVYLTVPFEMSGQNTFARTAGNTLKKATMPLGVVAGTRSIAADRIITYSTAFSDACYGCSFVKDGVPLLRSPNMRKDQKSLGRAYFEGGEVCCSCAADQYTSVVGDVSAPAMKSSTSSSSPSSAPTAPW